MNRLFLLLVSLSFATITLAQNSKQTFVSTDIDNFWLAYEKIISTDDTVAQYKYLRELYLDKGSKGLKSLVEARNYTEKEFIDAINKYPKFWNSLKSNTVNSKDLYPRIEADIEKLKQAYPSFKSGTIYFCIGAFRTPGTGLDDRVLIGSELALVDGTTIINEFPEFRQSYFREYSPRENIGLLCTHEYVHTQQKELIFNLLSMCLYEGVAEFVSCLATDKKSNSPAIEFGKKNQSEVVNQFVADLFTMSNNSNWMWGVNRNSLKISDLGYYIGYEICERYYDQSVDKQQAIKELIELDYADEKEVERIVNATRLLPHTLEKLYVDYEKSRPIVLSLVPFENGSQKVKPGLTKMTITFSESLTKSSTGVDFGPLGQEYFPQIKPERTFGEDGKSWTFEADLKPNRHYQILIENNFKTQSGVRLKPYLIDFKTTQ